LSGKIARDERASVPQELRLRGGNGSPDCQEQEGGGGGGFGDYGTGKKRINFFSLEKGKGGAKTPPKKLTAREELNSLRKRGPVRRGKKWKTH